MNQLEVQRDEMRDVHNNKSFCNTSASAYLQSMLTPPLSNTPGNCDKYSPRQPVCYFLQSSVDKTAPHNEEGAEPSHTDIASRQSRRFESLYTVKCMCVCVCVCWRGGIKPVTLECPVCGVEGSLHDQIISDVSAWLPWL